ncbi:MAG TPA: hypothetical protein VHM19_10855 [Polyangiales bacterium]|nr:hypothetical protein [Polyangiales bacterium]
MLAYLRCFGAERSGDRFPCARDRAFEAQVWSALEGLERCSAADPGRGGGEIRLDMRYGATHEVEIRATDHPAEGVPGLDVRAVSKCADPQLRAARSSLRTPRFLVQFRFELR